MELRPYQTECLDVIDGAGAGRWLVQLATGLGKTVIFASLPRSGRVLILSHREELVRQPLRYYDCLTGVEQASLTSSRNEEVVSASVQSLVKRLDRFAPDEWDTIVVDEAHHAAAPTYQAILEYFSPRRTLGFTATPNRGDGQRLDGVFDSIIFERDLLWGIENEYLARITCRRAEIGFDLSEVSSRMGDFAIGELERQVNIDGANQAVAKLVRDIGIPPILIFAVNRRHAHALAAVIPHAVALDGTSRHREETVSSFIAGDIPVLVNCQLFTEGTDLPPTRTIVIARPTLSPSFYTQMVGRGVRRTDEKAECLLVDCVGASRHSLCAAHTLMGLDIDNIAPQLVSSIEGDLTDELPALIAKAAADPRSWISSIRSVNLWRRKYRYQFHDVRYTRLPSGALRVALPKSRWIQISPPDLRHHASIVTSSGATSGPMPFQKALDSTRRALNTYAKDESTLWRESAFKRWAKQPASDRQKALVSRLRLPVATTQLTKGLACQILDCAFAR